MLFEKFRRNRREESTNAPAANDIAAQAARTTQESRIKRDVQLRLHANQVFPSEITVIDGEVAEVSFSPMHPRSAAAAETLRTMQRRGQIEVEGPLNPDVYNMWTARLRLIAQ